MATMYSETRNVKKQCSYQKSEELLRIFSKSETPFSSHDSEINTTADFVVIMIDDSGSTNGEKIYPKIVERTLIETVNKYSNSKIITCTWNNTYKQCSFETALKLTQEWKGGGGTEPIAIVKFFVDNDLVGKNVKLIIITDGQANPSSADVMISSLPNSTLGISSVDVIVINTGGICDRSIGVPFGRGIEYLLLYYSRDGKLEKSSTVSTIDIERFKRIHEINTIEDYLANSESIELVVMNLLAGMDIRSKQVQDVIVVLRDLKSRIMRNEALIAETKANADSTVSIGINLWQSLKSGDFSKSMTILKDMWSSSPSINVPWNVMIDCLIGRIERDLKNYGLDLVQTSSKRYESAMSAAVVDPELESSGKKIDCPVEFELSEFVAMMSVKGISKLDEKSFMDSFREFRGMGSVGNPDFCKEVCDLFMPPLSCVAYQSLRDHGINTHPTTRQEFGPALSLGNSPAAIKYADYALTVAMTKGRTIINPFYLWCIIAYLAQHKQLPSFAMESYGELILAQQMVRLDTTMVPICLGIIPGEIAFKVPAIAAIWSILASPSLLVEGKHNPMINVVWRYAPYLNYLLTMLQIAGIAPPEGANRNFTINTVFISITRKCKEPNFKFLMDGMIYEAISGHPSFVPKYEMTVQEHLKTPDDITISKPLTDITLIESAQRIFPKEMQKLSNVMSPIEAAKIIRFFVKKVRPDIKMTEIAIIPGFSTSVPDAQVAFTTLPSDPDHLKICKSTCRPFCMVMYKGTMIDWRDYLKFEAPTIINDFIGFSIHESFGMFVDRFGCYPTWIDLAHWLYYSRVMNGSKHPALPKSCAKCIEVVLEDFSEIMTTVSPKEFTQRRAASMRRVDRKRIEQAST